ncbi:MAG: hypothetical protein V1773_04290 [bacterium]
MKKNMVYFILYVVLITELLIVITERDELDEAQENVRTEMLRTIYKDPVEIKVPLSVDYEIKNQNSFNIVLSASGLVSEEEKQTIKYYIDVDPTSKVRPSNWPSIGLNSTSIAGTYAIEKDSSGNAIFVGSLDREGDYIFNVYAEVTRTAPSYMKALPGLVEEFKLFMEETNQLNVKTKAALVNLHARRLGGVQTSAAEIRF